MSLDSHVSCSITVQDAFIARDSFDSILIAAYHANYGDRVRTYTNLTGMVSDGFTAGEAAYLAAARVFAQTPRVSSVKIGRRALPATQIIDITPTAHDNTEYTVTIRHCNALYSGTSGVAVDCSFTSGSSATVAQICTGLTAAIEAEFVGLANDGTSKITLTGSSGEYFDVSLSDDYDTNGNSPSLSREDVTTDAGIATDLAAISAVDSDWYGLIIADGQDSATIEAAAAWAESNSKLYVAECADEEITAGTGLCVTLKAANYYRTHPYHTRDPGDYVTAGLMAKMFANDPGSQTWAYQTVAGATVQKYTSTAITNMEADNCNYFFELGGQNVTYLGKSAQGRFVDITRGIDWLKNTIQSNILTVFLNEDKVDFTDAGVSVVKGEIWRALKEGERNGLLVIDNNTTVTAPDVADVSTANKAARTLPDVEFNVTLKGAIHTVTVTGTVSV